MPQRIRYDQFGSIQCSIVLIESVYICFGIAVCNFSCMLSFFLYVPQTICVEIDVPVAYLSVVVIVQAMFCGRIFAKHRTYVGFVQLFVGIYVRFKTPVTYRIEVFIHIIAYTHRVLFVKLIVQ